MSSNKAYNKQWEADHRTERLAYKKEYNLTHKEERRAYSLPRITKVRAAVAKIKMERGCIDCGYATHPAALDFDHVRGDKRYNISQLNNTAWSKVLEEIEKCEVRCANCHRIKTSERRSNGN